MPFVDAMRVGDDVGMRRLAENYAQAGDGDQIAVYHIAQHIPGAYGRQLVHIADKQQVRAQGERFEQVVRQRQVQHGRFVHDDQVGCQRVLGVMLEPLAG